MHDQMNLSEFLARLDKACERMNAGLGAIAAVLAVAVLFMGVLRASEMTVDLSAANMSVLLAPDDQQPPTFWSYY